LNADTLLVEWEREDQQTWKLCWKTANNEGSVFYTNLCWLCGTSILESTVCASTFFFSSHFALVKYMKLCGKWRTALAPLRYSAALASLIHD